MWEGECNESTCAFWGVGSSWGPGHFCPSAEALCSCMWRHALQGRQAEPQVFSPSWHDFWLSFTLLLCPHKQLDDPVCQHPFHMHTVSFCNDTILSVNPPCKHLKGLNYPYYTSTPLRQWEQEQICNYQVKTVKSQILPPPAVLNEEKCQLHCCITIVSQEKKRRA